MNSDYRWSDAYTDARLCTFGWRLSEKFSLNKQQLLFLKFLWNSTSDRMQWPQQKHVRCKISKCMSSTSKIRELTRRENIVNTAVSRLHEITIHSRRTDNVRIEEYVNLWQNGEHGTLWKDTWLLLSLVLEFARKTHCVKTAGNVALLEVEPSNGIPVSNHIVPGSNDVTLTGGPR